MEVVNNIHKGFSKEFLNRHINSSHEGKYIVGSFFEELTRELFNGIVERLRTNNSCDICPDLREIKRQEFFIECKAAKARIYTKHSKAKRIEWKMKVYQKENYINFLNNYFPDCSLENPDFNPSLLYAFWGYDIEKKKIEDFDKSSQIIKSLTYSDIKLYLIDSSIFDAICNLKNLTECHSLGEMYRLWHSDFKLLDSDKWSEFTSKWNLPVEDCFYASCEKSGLEINNKQVNSFPVRVLLSKDSYKKESIMSFLENNILGEQQ